MEVGGVGVVIFFNFFFKNKKGLENVHCSCDISAI